MSEQLSAEERAEEITRALADDLCAKAHPDRFDPDAGVFHCQECYALACEVMDAPTFTRLTARLASRDARLAALEARTEAAFAGIRCALVHWQPEGVSKAVSCANCQSWAASIAMPFFRETSGEDPRTHGLSHAPLLNGALLAPGFCSGCDEDRTLRAALHPDPSEAGA